MKSLLFLVFLCIAVAAGVALFYAGNVSKREAKVLGWANSLIWESLGMPHDVKFTAESVTQDAERPELWNIAGRLETAGVAAVQPYAAVVERTCGSAERRCWRLAELQVAGKRLVGNGSQPGEAAMPPAAESSTGTPGAKGGAAPDRSPPVDATAAPPAAEQEAAAPPSEDAAVAVQAPASDAGSVEPAPPAAIGASEPAPVGDTGAIEPAPPPDTGAIEQALPADLTSGLSDLQPYEPKQPLSPPPPLPRRRP